MSTCLEEHDYIGLSEASNSKMGSSDKSTNNNNGGLTLNLKATELRLGLPGSESESESPERDSVKNNNLVSAGAKRGFSDTINGGSGNWVFNVNGGSEVELSKNGGFLSPKSDTNNSVSASAQDLMEKMSQVFAVAAPATKAQVVGWPPIRSFRKNTMASNPPKNDDVGWLPVRTFRMNAMDTNHPLNNDNDVDAKSCLYVKVSMDGAPYLRKVDLNIYTTYIDLSSALEKMFSCFTIGSEYVLTYEDKDGDWMLVGDVPWDMFTGSCKRMRIMKSSEAIGLGTRLI